MNESRVLGEFAATTGYADLPDDVVHETKRLILDQLACQIGCARLPWSHTVLRGVLGLAGPGPSSVVVHGDRLPADEAAFVNSAFAHGNEIDDAHISFRTHPGSVVVPAALAAVQAGDDDVTGDRLVLAVALGCEVMLRVADAATDALKDVRFHNTSSSVGPFGSAVAVARVLGLDPPSTEHAIAIAGYHSGGVRRHSLAGGSVKRLQTAIGSKAGVRSAWLAMSGVTGPDAILEGPRGFLESFSGDFDPSRLTDGLGTKFLSQGPYLKRFSVKYRIHSTIDAIVGLVARYEIAFDEISTVRIGVSESTRRNFGCEYEPARAGNQSDATQAAQLSVRFAVAVVAKFGPGILSRLGPAELDDPEVLDLARRIDVYREEAQEREDWMNWGCVATIVTTTGEAFSIEVPAPIGSPRNPMDDSEVAEKFHRFVTPQLGTLRSDAIAAAVWAIEDSRPGTDLLPLTLLESSGET